MKLFNYFSFFSPIGRVCGWGDPNWKIPIIFTFLFLKPSPIQHHNKIFKFQKKVA
jgi:hypothetical protein